MKREDDASYKLLFSSPDVVRDLVMGFIPDDWLHSLDYATLEKIPGSYVADDLRQRADDVVWRVRAGGKWLYLYLLIEFQSSVDAWMAVRLMTYVGLLYGSSEQFTASHASPDSGALLRCKCSR